MLSLLGTVSTNNGISLAADMNYDGGLVPRIERTHLVPTPHTNVNLFLDHRCTHHVVLEPVELEDPALAIRQANAATKALSEKSVDAITMASYAKIEHTVKLNPSSSSSSSTTTESKRKRKAGSEKKSKRSSSSSEATSSSSSDAASTGKPVEMHDLDLTRVGVELKLRGSFDYTDICKWEREDKELTNAAAASSGATHLYYQQWNNISSFHKKWNNMVLDYASYPTDADYYKRVVLGSGILHPQVPIFTTGINTSSPNNLDVLFRVFQTLRAKSSEMSYHALYDTLIVIALRAWFTINGRYQRYEPTGPYNESYPRFILRLYRHQDLFLVKCGPTKKLKTRNCFYESKEEVHDNVFCPCVNGDLYDIARHVPASEFVYYTMARLIRCAPEHMGRAKEAERYTREHMHKEPKLWLSSRRWTIYPLDAAMEMFINALEQGEAEGRCKIEIGYHKAAKMRNKRVYNLKYQVNKKQMALGRYGIVTFYHHLFGDPYLPTLRAYNVQSMSQTELLCSVCWDVCNFLSKTEINAMKIEMKKHISSHEASIVTRYAQMANCVETRYCNKGSLLTLAPPMCIGNKRGLVTNIIGSDVYDEISPSWISVNYVLWSLKRGHDLFNGDTIGVTKWPITRSGTAVVNAIEVRRGIWIHTERKEVLSSSPKQTTMIKQEETEATKNSETPTVTSMSLRYRHLLMMCNRSMHKDEVDVGLVRTHDALCVIARNYQDVIRTLATHMGIGLTTSEHDILHKFIYLFRSGARQIETSLQAKVSGDNNNSNTSPQKKLRADTSEESDRCVLKDLLKICRDSLYGRSRRLSYRDEFQFSSTEVGLGVIDEKQIQNCLPRLSIASLPPATTSSTPIPIIDVLKFIETLRTGITGCYLSASTLQSILASEIWKNISKYQIVVDPNEVKTFYPRESISSHFFEAQPLDLYLQREYALWYTELWYPLIATARLMMLRPYIKAHSYGKKIVSYMDSIRVQNDLEKKGRIMVHEINKFIDDNPNRLIPLIRGSDLSDPDVKHVLRTIVSILTDRIHEDETYPAVIDECKLRLNQVAIPSSSSSSATSNIHKHETPIWWSCYHELVTHLETEPLRVSVLIKMYNRFENDNVYIIQTSPPTGILIPTTVLESMKDVHTPSQRVVLLLKYICDKHPKDCAGKIGIFMSDQIELSRPVLRPPSRFASAAAPTTSTATTTNNNMTYEMKSIVNAWTKIQNLPLPKPIVALPFQPPPLPPHPPPSQSSSLPLTQHALHAVLFSAPSSRPTTVVVEDDNHSTEEFL